MGKSKSRIGSYNRDLLECHSNIFSACIGDSWNRWRELSNSVQYKWMEEDV